MKSYTNLEQSQKLAKILQINSADMYYYTVNGDWEWYETPNVIERRDDLEEHAMPAWSLAALMEVLPSYIGDCHKTLYYDNGEWYCTYSDGYCTYSDDGEFMITIDETHANSAIDAVVEMILQLKEKDLI